MTQQEVPQSETPADQAQMTKHGISSEARTVYHYREHKYEHLRDAVRYAELEAEKALK